MSGMHGSRDIAVRTHALHSRSKFRAEMVASLRAEYCDSALRAEACATAVQQAVLAQRELIEHAAIAPDAVYTETTNIVRNFVAVL